MRLFLTLLTVFSVSLAHAQQLELDFGDGLSILKKTNYYSSNIEQSYDIPEEITKMWDERDFAFEIADGYYGGGPTVYYKIYDTEKQVIGYMMAQTLMYTEDPEYHVAYTVCTADGTVVIELEYDVYHVSENDVLPPELQWVDEDAY